MTGDAFIVSADSLEAAKDLVESLLGLTLSAHEGFHMGGLHYRKVNGRTTYHLYRNRDFEGEKVDGFAETSEVILRIDYDPIEGSLEWLLKEPRLKLAERRHYRVDGQ